MTQDEWIALAREEANKTFDVGVEEFGVDLTFPLDIAEGRLMFEIAFLAGFNWSLRKGNEALAAMLKAKDAKNN